MSCPSADGEVALGLLGPRLSFDWTSDEERELEVVPDKAGEPGGSGVNFKEFREMRIDDLIRDDFRLF